MEFTESQLAEFIGNVVSKALDERADKGQQDPVPIPKTSKAELRAMSASDVKAGLGRSMRALIAGGGTKHGAIRKLKEWGDGENSPALKFMLVGDDPSGGFLVPSEVSSQFIELLLPYAVVRGMNPMTVPMPSGNLKFNGGDEAPTAYYIGEGEAITPSQATFRQVNLAAKKLTGLVPLSNDLIRTSSPAVDTIVSNWLLRVLGNREDLAFIRGDGTGQSPKGLRYLATSANVNAITGSTITTVASDLANMQLRMRNVDLPENNLGWLMAPRTEMYLKTLHSATPNQGYFPYKAEMEQGRLLGYPFAVTSQIPVNLGGGSNESEMYLVNFGDVVIGDTMSVQMAASSEASYSDGSVTRSSFQSDLTLIRAIAEHDIGVMYDESIQVLTGVTWAP